MQWDRRFNRMGGARLTDRALKDNFSQSSRAECPCPCGHRRFTSVFFIEEDSRTGVTSGDLLWTVRLL